MEGERGRPGVPVEGAEAGGEGGEDLGADVVDKVGEVVGVVGEGPGFRGFVLLVLGSTGRFGRGLGQALDENGRERVPKDVVVV